MAESEGYWKEVVEVKVDFHTHTNHSFDSYMSPRKLLRMAEKRGLDAIAITDHDSMDVFDDLEDNDYYGSRVKVIKGCEFKTKFGDIVGIFIDNKIDYKDPYDLIQKIHKKGGLAFIPHPFSSKNMPLNFLKSQISIIEGLNGRSKNEKNIQAKNFAKSKGIRAIYCSDAHSPSELGKIYNEFDCKSLNEVKEKLMLGEFVSFGKETNRLIVNYAKILGAYRKRGFFGLMRRVL